jgi:hypothetical protein
VDLRETWQALCAQPGAAGDYRLREEVLPYLQHWWSGLREMWGSGIVPPSFVRRIGFSVLRYLIVLHFLLGKSRHPIDLETAHLATRFAEYHLESTREMLRAYENAGAGHVQKVVEIRNDLRANGRPSSTREIQRRLGKRMRDMFPAEKITAITECLDRIDLGEELLSMPEQRTAKSAEIVGRFEKLDSRFKRGERKRKERRLRELRRSFLAAVAPDADDGMSPESGLVSVLGDEDQASVADVADRECRPATVIPFPLDKAAWV